MKKNKNDMLRTKLWKYLRSERLKNATRSKFESERNFEELRKAIRAEEYEMNMNSSVNVKSIRFEKADEIMKDYNRNC